MRLEYAFLVRSAEVERGHVSAVDIGRMAYASPRFPYIQTFVVVLGFRYESAEAGSMGDLVFQLLDLSGNLSDEAAMTIEMSEPPVPWISENAQVSIAEFELEVRNDEQYRLHVSLNERFVTSLLVVAVRQRLDTTPILSA